jgi:hypothetical protein
MRKVSVLIGICMLAGLAITLFAQSEADLPPIMKDNAATNKSLQTSIMSGAAADVVRDAEKLQTNFTKAMGIFKALKSEAAVALAKANVDAAGEIIKAAKANNLEAAKAPAATIAGSCKSCHAAHREQLPDKTYKFKQ